MLLSIGIGLFLAGICLPAFIKWLGYMGLFGGPWGGFGLFVIALHLRPWLAGCGALGVLAGLLTMRKQNSN
jgi:hypothetical protein